MKKNVFNVVPMLKPKKNFFDLSHDVKLSTVMGRLTPCMLMDVIPGDQVNISVEMLNRFAPMLAPIMHRVNVYIHYFFCPNRIVWSNWEDFITNTDNGTGIPVFPTIDMNKTNWNKLADYLGLPDPNGFLTDLTEQVSAIPFSVYQLIYNEYYRDQNLQPEVAYELQDGDNTGNYSELGNIHNRAWEHDYFTSCLPFAQKGPSVDIPIGDVELDPAFLSKGNIPLWIDGSLLTPATPGNLITAIGPQGHTESNATPGGILGLDPKGSLVVNSTTINDLRTAFALQKWFEKNARGGTRYIEHILVHYGVHSSDKRLQRPEYITGTQSPVVISEVLNTTGTADAPQGDMTGHALSVINGHVGSYFVEEHGYIMGIMSIMPKTAYFQGIERHWRKTNDFSDFYYPDFANLGEQEVKYAELYAYTANSGETFGYIPRYSEHRFVNNRVAGDFRNSLKFWHMAREFGSLPSLDSVFIESDPTDRIFAVTDGVDNMWCHVFNKIKAFRPIPKYGVPSF